MRWVFVVAALVAAGVAWSLQPADTQLVFVMEELVVDGVPVADAKTFRGSARYTVSGAPGAAFASMLDPIDGGERVVPLDGPTR